MDKARKKTNILTSWVHTGIFHPNVTFYIFSFIFLILYLYIFSLTLKICFLLTLVFILALSYNINKNKFKITVPILILSKITDWSLIFFTVVFVFRIYTGKCIQSSKAIRNPFLCVWLFPIWHGVHSESFLQSQLCSVSLKAHTMVDSTPHECTFVLFPIVCYYKQFAFNSNITTCLWYYYLYFNMKLRLREMEYFPQVCIAVWNQNLAVYFRVECLSGIRSTTTINCFLCFMVFQASLWKWTKERKKQTNKHTSLHRHIWIQMDM